MTTSPPLAPLHLVLSVATFCICSYIVRGTKSLGAHDSKYQPHFFELQRQREVWVRMTQNINSIFPATSQVSKVQSGLEGSPQAVQAGAQFTKFIPNNWGPRGTSSIPLSMTWNERIQYFKTRQNQTGFRSSSPNFCLFVACIEQNLPHRCFTSWYEMAHNLRQFF